MSETPALEYPKAPVGDIEPHAALLTQPPDEQLLYKMMTVENFLRSIEGNYLHFNRVDSYTDFPGADPHDSQQLPKDQVGNAGVRFAGSPGFSAADYYDQSRSRTYACCFSLEKSNYIWDSYANGSEKGKLCVVFVFGKLRAMLNATLQPGNSALEYNGVRCRQMFSVNYGNVDYVDWPAHRLNTEHLPNPVKYTYLKHRTRFSREKEFRISLSALGIGHFVLNDRGRVQFPPSLRLRFDFRSAMADQAVQQILCAPDSSVDSFQAELLKLGIILGNERNWP